MAFSTALSETFAALPRKSLFSVLYRLQASMHLYVRPLIMVVASVASVSVWDVMVQLSTHVTCTGGSSGGVSLDRRTLSCRLAFGRTLPLP